MNWFITHIAWDADFQADYPAEIFISWENGCTTKEEALDFAAGAYDCLILHALVIEE